jgi:serine/threonine protein kinase
MVPVAVVSTVILAIGVATILVFIWQRQRRRCSTCGAVLPDHANDCPAGATEPPLRIPEQPDSPPGEPSLGAYELVATRGPLAPKRFPIPSHGLTVGRHQDNDMVLEGEPMVSRQHAIVVVEDGQYVVYDRDSANGTWVNDERVFRRVMQPGDRIQVWQSEFMLAPCGATPTPTPAPPPAHPELTPTLHVAGDRLGEYVLEEVIGRGGMSEVYRARNPAHQQLAIKILQHADPYLVDKFVQEGNEIGPLLSGHPNIVRVHQFGRSADGRLYIVMELVAAPPLRRIMQKPLDEEGIVDLVGQVCSALGYAHRNGIVHRDIKPENILVTADGAAKVLDFGIAKLTSAATVTRNKIVGTPEYISPEQARGDPVTPASDVYSLGVVLYEMITGSVPFPRATDGDPLRVALDVVRQHIEAQPQSVRERNPDANISADLERVVLRALAKSSRDRYATATDMMHALGYQPSASPDAPALPPVRASLHILQGPRQGRCIYLDEEQRVLGRLDLDPSNKRISRQHMQIIIRGGSYWLQDMSKNGTWVDNQPVYGEAPLHDGSLIAVGETVLRLDTEAPI